MIEYIEAKSIVQRVKGGGWFGTDYNMNIYRGCSHGCIYCDSRSECYRDERFETVKVKRDALRIIRDDLARKVRSGVVATGAMSDPYNPLERELELTRHALELLSAYDFGVAIDTKGTLIIRDIDLLCEIKRRRPVLIKVTITAADDALAKEVEPRAPTSSARFQALKELAKTGIFCGVLLMPVLPYLTDNLHNIREIIRHTAQCGAKFIYPAFGMTLRDRQRSYYYAQLDNIRPGLSEKYQKKYGARYNCTAPGAAALYNEFAAQCERAGLLYKMRDIVNAYKQGYAESQLSFF